MLILFPVFFLAAVGGVALYQDRLLVRQQAERTAQELADELAADLWRHLTRGKEASGDADARWPVMVLDDRGRLLKPVPYDPWPEAQPLRMELLDQDQRRHWHWLASGENLREKLNESEAAELLGALSDWPEAVAAVGCYRLGMGLMDADYAELAEKAFARVLEFEAPRGETGLPLRPLAVWRLWQMSTNEAASVAPRRSSMEWMHEVCSNLVAHPSLLTPRLLAEVRAGSVGPEAEEAARWWNVWQKEELARQLYDGARSRLDMAGSWPRMVWVEVAPGADWSSGSERESESQSWLLVREGFRTPNSNAMVEDSQPERYRCWPRAAVVDWLTVEGVETSFRKSEEMAEDGMFEWILRGVPEFMGLRLELAGQEVLRATSRPREGLTGPARSAGVGFSEGFGEVDRELPVLARAARREAGRDWLLLSMHLTRPEDLFASQTRRTLWFGLLILAATAAALAGFVSSWRSFVRQQRLAEMRTQFVSSVTHELRAPIASVRLLAEGLERGRLEGDGRRREYYHLIVQECRRLTSMIENVLNFARMDQRRQRYEFQGTDPVRLVEETVKVMQPTATERGVRLVWQPPQTTVPEMNLDGQALQQALINLIDNALKHSAQGKEVLVGAELVRNGESMSQAAKPGAKGDQIGMGGSVLRLTVKDEGPGIPREEQERIFEQFYRLGSELRRETQGVGIGLSIVKHIVEAHRGRVRVESEVGQGSCFIMELSCEAGEGHANLESANEAEERWEP